MPIPDDDRFESYLKRFRPLVPEPLQIEEHGHGTRRPFTVAVWAAVAVAGVLVAAVLATYQRPKPMHAQDGVENSTNIEQLMNPQPLTIGSANALLSQAPSFKAAVDSAAFQSQATRLPNGKHSALAVLSKEKTKL